MLGKWIAISHYIAARRRRQWTNRELFERWQERRIVQHLEHIRSRSPFYRELWAGLPTERWREFPSMDKQTMMEHFDRLNTAGIRREQAFDIALRAERTRDFRPMIGSVTVGLSSGTSGNRGLFLVGERERHAWAGTVLARALPGSLLRSERIAFFLRADSNLYGSVSSSRLRFEFYDLLDPLELHLQRLNSYEPTLLVAPPSMLKLLADARADGLLRAVPARIISVAEVLEPLDRQRIEGAFGQTVHQIYQCTEGFLAATCEHGKLHLNEDLLHVEMDFRQENGGGSLYGAGASGKFGGRADGSGAAEAGAIVGRSFVMPVRPTKLAVAGGIDTRPRFSPILTDFTRLVQPIVRYRLDDLLTEDEPCSCRSIFRTIRTIEGRCDDLFYFPSRDGKRLVPVFPDFLSRLVLHAAPEAADYRFIQKRPDLVELMLAAPDQIEAGQRVEKALEQLCAKLNCRVPELAYADYVPPEPGRKQRRVERRCAIDEAAYRMVRQR